MRDIRISDNDNRFKFRVAGIVEKDNKILIDKFNNNSFYCFPGGHVELLEDTKKAIERELKEELFFKTEIDELLFIHENFFIAKDKNFHELCFYYKAHPIDKGYIPKDLIYCENDKGSLVNHEYKWINKDELLKYEVQPKIIIENIIQNNLHKHLVTNDI